MQLNETDRVIDRGSLPELTRLIREVVALPFDELADQALHLVDQRSKRDDPDDQSRLLRESLAGLIRAMRDVTPTPHRFRSAARDAAVARFGERVHALLPGAEVTHDSRVEVIVADTVEASAPIALIVTLKDVPSADIRAALHDIEFDVESETGQILRVSVAAAGGAPEELPPNVW